MKQRILSGLLVLEAIACVVLSVANVSLTGIFSTAVAFPFEQIGIGLRVLSLSGGFGNMMAIVLYIIVSLLPMGAFLVLRKRRKLHIEDGLLVLLCAALFGVLYLMVNPGFITEVLGVAARPPIGNAILGSMMYALLVGYLILRALRLFFTANVQKLERYMAIMLIFLNALFVFLAFGICLRDLLASISSLRASNNGNEHLLGASYVFLILEYMVNALPYVLDIFVVFAAYNLLNEIRKDRYSAETVAAAERMSRRCAIALIITTLAMLSFNLLQLLFSKMLMVVNSSVQIPVMSILFVLISLLLTRFIFENKQLKDENDQFI